MTSGERKPVVHSADTSKTHYYNLKLVAIVVRVRAGSLAEESWVDELPGDAPREGVRHEAAVIEVLLLRRRDAPHPKQWLPPVHPK